MKEVRGRSPVDAIVRRWAGACVASVLGMSVGCSPDKSALFDHGSVASGAGTTAAGGAGGAGGADDSADAATASGGTKNAASGDDTSSTSGGASAGGASTAGGGGGSDTSSDSSMDGSSTKGATTSGGSKTSDAGTASTSMASTSSGTDSTTAGGTASTTAGDTDSTTSSEGGQGGSQSSTSTNGNADITCAMVDLGEALGERLYAEYVSHDGDRADMRMAMECNGGPPWVTFAWSAPLAGTYRISTLGSDYDTVLFVLPACGHEVTRCSDDTPNSITSATELRLSEGELLIIDVGVWDAALGSETMPHLVLNITEVD